MTVACTTGKRVGGGYEITTSGSASPANIVITGSYPTTATPEQWTVKYQTVTNIGGSTNNVAITPYVVCAS